MPRPRPYGEGPYGKGPYERYRGNLFEVGGATQVAFAPRVTAYRLIAIAGRPSIQFSVQMNGLQRDVEAAGATQIAFDAKVAGATRIMALHPLTEIEFAVWGEMIESWTADAACRVAAWPPAAGCETGVWQPVATVPPGQWGTGAACGSGSWQPVAPGRPWKAAA